MITPGLSGRAGKAGARFLYCPSARGSPAGAGTGNRIAAPSYLRRRMGRGPQRSSVPCQPPSRVWRGGPRPFAVPPRARACASRSILAPIRFLSQLLRGFRRINQGSNQFERRDRRFIEHLANGAAYLEAAARCSRKITRGSVVGARDFIPRSRRLKSGRRR